jgi:hypothetical protein
VDHLEAVQACVDVVCYSTVLVLFVPGAIEASVAPGTYNEVVMIPEFDMSADSAHTAQWLPERYRLAAWRSASHVFANVVSASHARELFCCQPAQHAENQACEQQRNVRAASEALSVAFQRVLCNTSCC